MRVMKYFGALLLSFFLTVSALFAEVKPASPFADHMVLQRGVAVPVWGMADPGEKVTVSFMKQKLNTTAGADGKWRVNLSKLKAGGPFEMTLAGNNTVTLQDVYVGEVWVCSGQSNMDMTVAKEDRYWCGVVNEAEEVAAANYPLIRVFDVDFVTKDEPQARVGGKWEVCSPQTIGHLSAVAYFFARDLQKKLNVPIGLITTAFGASTAEAWTSRPALEANPKLTFLLDKYGESSAKYNADTAGQRKYQEAITKWEADKAQAKADGKEEPRKPKNPNPRVDQHSPCVLWNGMVAPLVPYAMRGALWYQGESNSPTAKVYRDMMETLIADWRKAWGQGDFPFLYVQLANIGKEVESDPAKGGNEAIKREAQLQNLSIPHTGMAVAIDNADPDNPNNVHPKNKQDIGRRLALVARAQVYSEKIPYSGPIFERMTAEGNTIRLHFKHVNGGLAAKDNKLVGFAIAGEDKKFVWADAKLDGNTLVVSSPGLSKPVAVRYGWGGNPPISLYNKAGLPASPFRTDAL